MFASNFASLLSASVLLAYSVNAQLAGQTAKIQTKLDTTKCLAAASLYDGAPVVIQDCGANATSLNSWEVSGGVGVLGQFGVNHQYCLDVTDGVDADGTKLQIWTCGPRDDTQQFTPTASSTIQWSDNKCVDVTDGVTTDGNQVQIWDCVENSNNQAFNFVPVTYPASFTIAWTTVSGHCISAYSNATNAPVTIEDCTEDAAGQTWTDPTHTGQMVMYDDLCVTPSNDDSLANGTPLVLAPCDSSNVAQTWNYETGFSGAQITNLANKDACIDLTNSNSTAGNQLQVWACTAGNTNQIWAETNTW
ncbi:hypothetical protein MSAN_00940800 [Mycena sanguinolenta]|uniref:Ricin B lectin domain-containing protein n=1 Tax=Mycena sanguinolenta TaxID=230812 RepID=A0A8H6YTD9_9AGAR|nr:hypothetical protein MSAN_00940800 [Mycena sanguinolenta]